MIRPIAYTILSLLFGLYGIVIVLGECSLVYPDLHAYLSPLGPILGSNKSFFITFLVTVPSLCMFLVYTCYGLFNFRLSKFYGLFPYHQTDPCSLVYSALFTTKLAFPICYNFLLLVSMYNGKTTFEQVMGVIDLVPYLGQNFQQYFPCIIFVFLVLNAFETYSNPVG